MLDDNALIIFAKYPDPSTVKTRLSPVLNDDDRAELYIKMMRGTFEKFGHLFGITTYIFYTPIESDEYFRQFGLAISPQEGLDLGERMFNAIKQMLSLGFKNVSIIGTDIPDLTIDIINEGYERLMDNDLVIGEALDGGYYLIGMKKAYPELFTSIAWSTDIVAEQTLIRAGGLGLNYYKLKVLRDIDRPEDLVFV
ncbi:MAG: TIGR04282 family arsenosugar biosynthesis glycosyltransferase [Nitrospirae bacterium]|nr:TIGR04282 family arsenosugar biosynthesis glycosyltransferase [Nitrospirota bacterium]